MLALIAAAALSAAAAEPPSFVATPPPGWEDVTGKTPSKDVIVELKGPETSSFVLVRAPVLDLANRAAVRAYLLEVLAGLRLKSGTDFGPASALVSTRFENGTSFLHVRASIQGRPRLLLGVVESGGRTAIATLISNVPDTLLPSILSTVRATGAAADEAAGAASADDQLRFSLPHGATLRALTEQERKAGFVAAIVDLDSELMVMKVLEDDAGPARAQAQIVKQTVLSFPDVDAATLVPVQELRTAAGPGFIYASAAGRGPSAGARLLAGFLPWGYLGYSVLGKGKDPVELARASFAGLALGSSAEPRVVASTPRIPIDAARSLPKLPPGAKWAALGVLALVTALSYKLLS